HLHLSAHQQLRQQRWKVSCRTQIAICSCLLIAFCLAFLCIKMVIGGGDLLQRKFGLSLGSATSLNYLEVGILQRNSISMASSLTPTPMPSLTPTSTSTTSQTME